MAAVRKRKRRRMFEFWIHGRVELRAVRKVSRVVHGVVAEGLGNSAPVPILMSMYFSAYSVCGRPTTFGSRDASSLRQLKSTRGASTGLAEGVAGACARAVEVRASTVMSKLHDCLYPTVFYRVLCWRSKKKIGSSKAEQQVGRPCRQHRRQRIHVTHRLEQPRDNPVGDSHYNGGRDARK